MAFSEIYKGIGENRIIYSAEDHKNPFEKYSQNPEIEYWELLTNADLPLTLIDWGLLPIPRSQDINFRVNPYFFMISLYSKVLEDGKASQMGSKNASIERRWIDPHDRLVDLIREVNTYHLFKEVQYDQKKLWPNEGKKEQRQNKQIHRTFGKKKKDDKENIQETQGKDKEKIAKGPQKPVSPYHPEGVSSFWG